MASGESIITWNVANWVTVILIAGIGFAILGFIQKAINKKGSQGSQGNTANG